MRRRTFVLAVAVVAAAPLLAACSSKCPVPIAYDEATLKDIQKAISDLPKDNILRAVMHDYEMERDDLRFCR